ncbi:MAG TPA: hypothetical protein VLA88_05725 [Candidatus Saccharimonadales bacterium]|nr:hypothetical protein [Candidatus Saccharimonadales bacterium]
MLAATYVAASFSMLLVYVASKRRWKNLPPDEHSHLLKRWFILLFVGALLIGVGLAAAIALTDR